MMLARAPRVDDQPLPASPGRTGVVVVVRIRTADHDLASVGEPRHLDDFLVALVLQRGHRDAGSPSSGLEAQPVGLLLPPLANGRSPLVGGRP